MSVLVVRTLFTRARPTLRLLSRTPVHNKTTAVFRGRLPGPQNDSVAIYLQVKEGDGWEVFSQTTTSSSGAFTIRYPFRRVFGLGTSARSAEFDGCGREILGVVDFAVAAVAVARAEEN